MSGTYAVYPPTSSGSGIPKYANLAAFPSAVSAGNGALAIALDTDTLYISDGSSWLVIGAPGVALSVGTFDSGTPSANGAHIDTNALIMQSASASNPGLVNIGTQTLAGVKTFSSAPIFSSLSASTALVLDGSKNVATLAYGSANIASSIVQRDLSGNFAAGTITASLTGTASGNPPNARLISTTAPLTGGGDLSADRTLAITQATTSTNGYLSSTDWNTFNGKQASGSYITALTGDVTATGPGSVAASLVATTNATLTTLSGLTTATALVSVGSITTGNWNATTVAINHGGTGVTSVTSSPTASAWAGWDANKNFSANSVLEGYATTVTAAGTTTLTVGSAQHQFFTGTTTQTLLLPVVSTLVLGQTFTIVNNSSGVVTIQSSGGNIVQALPAITSAEVTCVAVTGTGSGSWVVRFFYSISPGTVTSVGMSVPAFLSISGSPVTTSGTLAVGFSGTALPVANGGTGLTAGVSGGVLGYTATGTLASSVLLTANQLIIGGGAAATPTPLAAGSQFQVLVMGASNPGYGQVALNQSAAVTGTLAVGNGGTGQTSVTYAPGTTAGFVATSGVLGFTDGSAGAAGYLGQTMQTTASAGSYPSSGTYGDTGNLALTAGRWMLFHQVYFSAGGATYTNCVVGISTNSGSSSAGLTMGDNLMAAPNSVGSDMSASVVGYSVSISSTTTFYGKVRASYVSGTPTYYSRLTAYRTS